MSQTELYGYTLAPFSANEAHAFEERLGDPEVWKPYSWFGYNYQGTPGGSPQTAVFGEHGFLAVRDALDRLVGRVQWVPGYWYGGANRNRGWIIGMMILPEYRRSRATTAALILLIDYLFTHTPAHRIEAVTPAEAVQTRGFDLCGMTREGTMRKAQWREGEWHDMAIFGILREEWNR